MIKHLYIFIFTIFLLVDLTTNASDLASTGRSQKFDSFNHHENLIKQENDLLDLLNEFVQDEHFQNYEIENFQAIDTTTHKNDLSITNPQASQKTPLEVKKQVYDQISNQLYNPTENITSPVFDNFSVEVNSTELEETLEFIDEFLQDRQFFNNNIENDRATNPTTSNNDLFEQSRVNQQTQETPKQAGNRARIFVLNRLYNRTEDSNSPNNINAIKMAQAAYKNAYNETYRQSVQGKASKKITNQKYYKSDKGKTAHKNYEESDKYITAYTAANIRAKQRKLEALQNKNQATNTTENNGVL